MEAGKSMRSPLSRARGLGAARSGVEHWWRERLTSVALVPLSLWFVYAMVTLDQHDYFTVYNWLARPWNSLLMLLFTLTTLYHTRLGVRVIIEDYVHHKAFKTLWMTVLSLVSTGLMAAAVFFIARVAFGA